jgi:hypothetical protein
MAAPHVVDQDGTLERVDPLHAAHLYNGTVPISKEIATICITDALGAWETRREN